MKHPHPYPHHTGRSSANRLKRLLAACIIVGNVLGSQGQTFLDLTTLFNVDAVLEPNGTGLGDALDAEGRRLAAGTLPAGYADGIAIGTQDGRARFRFGNLKQSSLDAVRMDGQVLDVVDGSYESLDLALLSAPGALAYPFGELELRYTDGTRATRRLGPVPGWFNSPMAFDHTLYRFTDSSQVETILSFRTDFSDTEAAQLVQERGNGNSGGTRFVDGTGYVLYRIGDLGALKQGRLAVTVGNNFVISIATEYLDPDVSTTEGYTEVANSMTLHDGFEHRALGNLKAYEIDLEPYLAKGTGEIYVLLTDATTSNGWGPFIQQVMLYTGTARNFEAALEPTLDTRQATVHAMFRTATDAEKPYLFDNQGSGPSNRGHRFADGSGSITYRFDLQDDLANAKLTVDMANNFVVSLSGASESVRYANVAAATPEEKAFLVDEGGSIAGGDFRFADGNAYMVYQFDLPDDTTTAFAKLRIGNQFVIEAATGTSGDFKVEMDWVAESGQETRDNSNLAFYDVDLTPYLANNPTKVVQLRLSDGLRSDGWGPYLVSIAIQNRKDSGEAVFTPVLNAQTLFGEDIRTEYNKKYYTVDLTSVLANNPKKEFFVRFTDGSTADGWGPGIFWMAIHTGALGIQTDEWVFPDLKTTLADPTGYGAGLIHRRYPVDPSKTLSAIALPTQPTTENNVVHLLAGTLNSAAVAPAITTARLAGNLVRLAWAASSAGYRLQSSATLGGSAAWTDVTQTPQALGQEWVVDLTPTDSSRFFRLTK
jgi:hypothetical protein